MLTAMTPEVRCSTTGKPVWCVQVGLLTSQLGKAGLCSKFQVFFFFVEHPFMSEDVHWAGGACQPGCHPRHPGCHLQLGAHPMPPSLCWPHICLYNVSCLSLITGSHGAVSTQETYSEELRLGWSDQRLLVQSHPPLYNHEVATQCLNL